MRISTLPAVTAAVLGLAVVAHGPADAQSVQPTLECFDADSGGYRVVGMGSGKIPASECDGSINKVFRGTLGLTTLTPGNRILTAVTNCGLPNGPYRRLGLATGDPRLDYVTLQVNNPSPPSGFAETGGANSVSNQLGINPGFELRVDVSGSSTANSGSFTVKDTTILPGTDVMSQILDAPGPDWIMLLKSSGGGQSGTLVCDVNMWYDENGFDPETDDHTTVEFGIKDFATSHGVNEIVIGWAAGPSGFGSQGAVQTACDAQNPDLAPGDPRPDSGMPGADTTASQEAFVGTLVGFYKTLAMDSSPPVNATACTPDSNGFMRYCDSSEMPGQVNACNPDSDFANGPLDGVNFGATGGNTHCGFYFSASGSPTVGKC